MKTFLAESLHNALSDHGLQIKNLSVDPYMKTIKLIKKLQSFLEERAEDIQTLVKEYNKDYTVIIKSKAFVDAQKKKEEELTPDEQELLKTKPAVVALSAGRLSGPSDFIDKVNAINDRELKFKKDELNYIGDGKIFKATVENASTNNQAILYDFLFKQ